MTPEKIKPNLELVRINYLTKLDAITQNIKHFEINSAGITNLGNVSIYYEPHVFILRMKNMDGSFIRLEQDRIDASEMGVKTRYTLSHKFYNQNDSFENIYRIEKETAVKKYINGGDPIISEMSSDDLNKASRLLDIINNALFISKSIPN